MSHIVVDTHVASSILNWHSSAQRYVEALRAWAALRANARATGRSLSPQDAWIAATALELGAPLATNNRRDFENIQALRLLRLLGS